MNNRERYNQLREGIKSLFLSVSHDMERAKEFRDCPVLEKKYQAVRNKFAIALYDIDRHNQAENKEKIIDSLICKWSAAQLLTSFPEMLDIPEGDIEKDISNMLTRAESFLESVTETPDDFLSAIEAQTLNHMHGFNDQQTQIYQRLDAAYMVLEDYTDAMKLQR